MPSLFSVHGYSVFFWSREPNEPIHVHVTKGKPVPNATKIWLTRDGGCILAHNNSKIPQYTLNEIMQLVSAQFFLICAKWKSHFKGEFSFYA